MVAFVVMLTSVLFGVGKNAGLWGVVRMLVSWPLNLMSVTHLSQSSVCLWMKM